MLILNIIPDNLKKEIEFRTVYRLTKNLFGLIIITIILYCVSILAALYLLEHHLADTTLKTNLISKGTENFTNQVKNINNQLNTIHTIQSESVKWSLFMKKLSDSIGDNISLTRLNLDREKSLIYLAGMADTRDGLLALKESLEKLGFFSEINFPIKNLLEKNNIAFEISAKIITYEF